MESCYLMMDVGGTGIKAGLFSPSGQMIGSVRSFPARAKEGRRVIFRNFACVIQEMAQDRLVEGIGMAFPGPFDYERGISLMRGLDKYDDIYGLCIRDGVMEQLEMTGGSACVARGCRFLFLHDVEAFAIGACLHGSVSGCRKVMCVCIGTGAGSAFVEDGRVLKKAQDGVPENGWIYNTPFKKGVIDDYVSVRGLRRLTESVFGQLETVAGPWSGEAVGGPALSAPAAPVDGAQLFALAEAGSGEAQNVFTTFGENVRDALWPFLDSFRPQGLVLGGQIAKSFSYFGKPLSEACRRTGTAVYTEPDTSIRAMEGLYAAWINTMEGK